MHMNVFNSFIYKQQKMEITKMPTNGKIGFFLNAMEYYSNQTAIQILGGKIAKQYKQHEFLI